jgi:hypothetical protein
MATQLAVLDFEEDDEALIVGRAVDRSLLGVYYTDE